MSGKRLARAKAALMLAAFVFGGVLGTAYWINHRPSTVVERPSGQPSAHLPVATVLGSAATVVFTTNYSCGYQEADSGPVSGGLVGLAIEDMRRLYPGWSVESFSASRVVLVREEPGLCPVEISNRLLQLDGGELVVYRGLRSHRGELLRRTGITVEQLGEAEREALAAGVELKGSDYPGRNIDEVVELYLEGLTE
ncbi:MAG: hypothetical protein AB1331_08910 [Bacillota bacterium]